MLSDKVNSTFALRFETATLNIFVMSHLDKEHDFFRSNYDQILAENLNKYIVISGEAVCGAFDRELDAYIFGSQEFGVGNFIIKLCSSQPQVTQNFNNRIIFG